MSDQTPTQAPPDTSPAPFTQLLLAQRKGQLHHDLSEKLQAATLAAVDLGKVATLTLTLKIVPSKDGETVAVSDKVTSKIPEPDAKPSTFFLGKNGELSRSNPAQDELPLRQVPKSDAGPARVVGGAS